jgi:hypothetical protein
MHKKLTKKSYKKPNKNKGEFMTMKKKKETNRYVICRTYSAGVFAGYLESKKGKEVILTKARRLWRWEGAASLSQLAMEGTKKPNECKFPCEVTKVELVECIELLDVTEAAKKSIAMVPAWTA